MSESRFNGVEPDMVLQIRVEGLNDAQRLIAIAALGMCRTLSLGVLAPDYACHRFFGPALMARLNQLGTPHPALCHAISLATELEGVFDIIPDKFAESIAEVEAELLKALEALPPTDLLGKRWKVRTFGKGWKVNVLRKSKFPF